MLDRRGSPRSGSFTDDHDPVLYDDPESARAALFELAQQVEDASDDSVDAFCAEVGAGDLETLLRQWEVELWPDVEQLARDRERFRRALRSMWAYNSPRFEERDALLWELGEWREFRLRAVVYANRLAESNQELSWQAIEPPRDIDFAALARLLRSMADWADRSASRPRDSGPPPGLARHKPDETSEDP